MSGMTAIVADIERASLEDGPGFRTVVFFKGCPLHCAWCHNPECISPYPQELFYPEKCIKCGMCQSGCFSGARVTCGRNMTADEIFSEILLDKDYYGTDGGVTFSGGEPLMQAEILYELIKKCKNSGIKTCIETSLCIFNTDVLKNLDYIIADFKIYDNIKHLEYVGISNEIVRENLIRLDSLGKPFEVHTPVITGVNDNVDEIASIADFLIRLKNIRDYKLLPYHPLGTAKQRALGLKEIKFKIPSQKKMEELLRYADISGQNQNSQKKEN